MNKKQVLLITLIILLASSLLSCAITPSTQPATPMPSPPQDDDLDGPTALSEFTATPTIVGDATSDPQEIIKELAVSHCNELTDAFNQRVVETQDWIRSIEEVLYTKNASEDLMIVEYWYRLDEEGYISEGYGWASDIEGVIQQESVFLNGWYDDVFVNNWYNLENDFSSEGEIQKLHGEMDSPMMYAAQFCASLGGSGSASMSASEYSGHPSIQFSYVFQTDALYDGDPQIKSLYFDRDSLNLLGLDTYWVQPNGNLKLVESTAYPVFEFGAEPPSDRFEEIWGRLKHGDYFVPFQEGAP